MLYGALFCTIIFIIYLFVFVAYQGINKKRREAFGDVWSAAAPLQIDNIDGFGKMGLTYLTGIKADDMQRRLTDTFSKDTFPDELTLNTDYSWQNIKVIPGKIHDAVIIAFMERSGFYKNLKGLYLVDFKYKHAHVSRPGRNSPESYLITMQIIIHQKSTMYAKVVTFTTLVNGNDKNILFKNVVVDGVVHEQNVGPVNGSTTSSNGVHN